MQIYAWQIDPSPSQWGIDALNTATPNLADLRADLPPSIKHRCLEYCYTKLWQIYWHRSLENHYTK